MSSQSSQQESAASLERIIPCGPLYMPLMTPIQQPLRQYSKYCSAYSSSALPEEDWTKIPDLADRRRLQNRIAQRNYRKKLRCRLEQTDRLASSSENGEWDKSAGSPKASRHNSVVESTYKATTSASSRTTPLSQNSPILASRHFMTGIPFLEGYENCDSNPLFRTDTPYPIHDKLLLQPQSMMQPSTAVNNAYTYTSYITSTYMPTSVPLLAQTDGLADEGFSSTSMNNHLDRSFIYRFDINVSDRNTQ